MEVSRNRVGKKCDVRHCGFILPEEAGAVGADADHGEGHDGEGGALLGGGIVICCLLEILKYKQSLYLSRSRI